MGRKMGKKKTGGGVITSDDDGEEFSGGLAAVLKKDLIDREANVAIVQLVILTVFKLSTKSCTKVAMTIGQVVLCFGRLWFYCAKNQAKGSWIRMPEPYETACFFIATFSLVYFVSSLFEYKF